MIRIEFMQRACHLARRGTGRVSPNPLVGCVLVRDGRIIGEGWHDRFGGPHAEVQAIRDAESKGHRVSGCDVYVTLEPCAHTGKTPPCADLLIEKQVGRVMIAMTDPNPRVSGKGITRLQEAGIPVHTGLLADACRELNRAFIHFITSGRPYIVLKAAVTLDGFIADRNGDSRWISSEPSRRAVHRLRSEVDAVLVGAGTVRKDNPALTVRMTAGRDPVRIVLNPSASLTPELPVFGPGSVLVADPDRLTRPDDWAARGVSLVPFRGRELAPLLDHFATMNLASILVEGGASVFGAFLEQGLVNEIIVYHAPVILGEGIPLATMTTTRTMKQALRLGTADTVTCLRV